MRLPDIYWQMIITLLVLSFIGVYQYGAWQTLPQLLSAVAVAVALDTAIKWQKQKRFVTPKSAAITGLFVGSLLNVGTLWYIAAVAAAVAIIFKHVIRTGGKNVFNPAAFGLVAVGLLLRAGSVWWSASSLIAIMVLGLLVTYRIKKLATAFTFVLVYDALFVLIASPQGILKNPLALLNPLVLFFAFFMLIEHKTSPLTVRAGMAYATLVAILSIVAYLLVPGLFLLIALLLGNIFNALNNRFRFL